MFGIAFIKTKSLAMPLGLHQVQGRIKQARARLFTFDLVEIAGHGNRFGFCIMVVM